MKSSDLKLPDDVVRERDTCDAKKDVGLFYNAKDDVLMGSDEPKDYAAAMALESLLEADARILEEYASAAMLNTVNEAGRRRNGTETTKQNAVDRLTLLKKEAWKVMEKYPRYLRGGICEEIACRRGGNANYIQGQLKEFFDSQKK